MSCGSISCCLPFLFCVTKWCSCASALHAIHSPTVQGLSFYLLDWDSWQIENDFHRCIVFSNRFEPLWYNDWSFCGHWLIFLWSFWTSISEIMSASHLMVVIMFTALLLWRNASQLDIMCCHKTVGPLTKIHSGLWLQEFTIYKAYFLCINKCEIVIISDSDVSF